MTALLLLGANTSGQSFLQKAAEANEPAKSSSPNTVAAQAAGQTVKNYVTPAAKVSDVADYVSAAGNNRADGKTPETPMKDIQKALDAIRDNGENGATRSPLHSGSHTSKDSAQ